MMYRLFSHLFAYVRYGLLVALTMGASIAWALEGTEIAPGPDSDTPSYDVFIESTAPAGGEGIGIADSPLLIDIVGGDSGALPVAILPFEWNGPKALRPDVSLRGIVGDDLYRSGRFLPILPKTADQFQGRFDDGIDFSTWRDRGVTSVVVGSWNTTADGYVVRFRLFDAFREQQLIGYSFSVEPGQLRRVAHEISDAIFERLINIPGIFSTRIAYITQREEDAGDIYTLNVADSDGFDARTVVSSKSPIMSPAWGPDGRNIAYVSFEAVERSAIYIQDIYTGKRIRASSAAGINGAPAWSPDGKKLALTLSYKGNPDIYILHIATGNLTQLTVNHGIDTEPAWHPSGETIFFTSNRSGSVQVYEISARGGTARRVTFEGTYNANAVPSPDGNTLAFVHSPSGKRFYISKLDLRYGTIETLTLGVLDESPDFSPNGRMIIYARSGGRDGDILSSVSIGGETTQDLTVGGGVRLRDPTWSPYLRE